MKTLRERWRLWLSLLLGLSCAATVIWYAWHQDRNFRNLRAVKPGVLYRSGQLTQDGLLRAMHELNIGTLVNLRGCDLESRRNTSAWEAELCEKNFVKFVSISLGSPEHPQHVTPEVSQKIIGEAIRQFLDILNNPEEYPRPILVHCLAGTHRTGVMCALYRMEEEGWSKDRALAEMQLLGYRDFTSPDPLRDAIINWVPLRDRTDNSAQQQLNPRLMMPVSRAP